MKYLQIAPSVLALGIGTAAAADDIESKAAVLDTYADIAEAAYADSLLAAQRLGAAAEALIESPSAEALEAAKTAWMAARVPYQQTEVYRFGNPIVDDWEGKVNAWPLDEGLIDYVDLSYGGPTDENAAAVLNVIANPVFSLSGNQVPTSIPKCNTGHLRREGGARAAQMAGRRGLRLSGNGGSGPGTAAVPSGRRISGLSGQRKAAAGAGRVRPGAGRAQPDRSPDGRDGLIRSTPSRRGHPRCREAGRRCQGGRARRNTSAGVR